MELLTERVTEAAALVAGGHSRIERSVQQDLGIH